MRQFRILPQFTTNYDKQPEISSRLIVILTITLQLADVGFDCKLWKQLGFLKKQDVPSAAEP
jgi:hypothetical protein